MSVTTNSILSTIPSRQIIIGGTPIHRLLPYSKKRMIGPFIYFDYFPETQFNAGEGINVPPHPHIGLSTLSYLLEGSILHNDSLSNRQILNVGDVNWMTAGKGISHSERTPESELTKNHKLHLLQFWVALPKDFEDIPPQFFHHPQNTIPVIQQGKTTIKLVAGKAFHQQSPVQTYSNLFFMDVCTPIGEDFEFEPQPNQEMAIYIINGQIQIENSVFKNDDFIVFNENSTLKMSALTESQFIVLGGDPLPEPRSIFWNFVSSSKDKIAKAAELWKTRQFPQVPGEDDIIPLPESN